MNSTVQRFRMSFEWKAGRKRYDEPERPTTWPAVFLALISFLDEHQGTFSLWFDDTEIEFSLEWDLSIIFEYLPRELEKIEREEHTTHFIAFADQSPAVSIAMTRHDQRLAVELVPILDASKYYAQFFGKTFHVDAAEFISEWVRFASTVLDAVLEYAPSFKDNPEIKAYADHLELVNSAVKTGKVDVTVLPART